MPGLTVCMFGVFSKVLTQLFCGLLPRPPNGAIGAIPGEICQKRAGGEDEWAKEVFGSGFAIPKTRQELNSSHRMIAAAKRSMDKTEHDRS